MKPLSKINLKGALSITMALTVVGLQAHTSWAIETLNGSTTGFNPYLKSTLAAAAIEDAAQFYGSGEVKGVLPLLMKELRTANPEKVSLTDEELIDSIVEQAEQLLESKEVAPEKKEN